jgi:hypothetical protein
MDVCRSLRVYGLARRDGLAVCVETMSFPTNYGLDDAQRDKTVDAISVGWAYDGDLYRALRRAYTAGYNHALENLSGKEVEA